MLALSDMMYSAIRAHMMTTKKLFIVSNRANAVDNLGGVNLGMVHVGVID